MQKVDRNKHIWEGWTVGDFIDELEPAFNMIMNNRSHIKPFKTEQEVKNWCKDNQPYYKRYIKEVNDYFIDKFKEHDLNNK
jgi:hypothetical protein